MGSKVRGDKTDSTEVQNTENLNNKKNVTNSLNRKNNSTNNKQGNSVTQIKQQLQNKNIGVVKPINTELKNLQKSGRVKENRVYFAEKEKINTLGELPPIPKTQNNNTHSQSEINEGIYLLPKENDEDPYSIIPTDHISKTDESPPLPPRSSVISKQKNRIKYEEEKWKERENNKQDLQQHELVSTEHADKNDEIGKNKSEIHGKNGYLSPPDPHSQSPKINSQKNKNQQLDEEVKLPIPPTKILNRLTRITHWVKNYLPRGMFGIPAVKKDDFFTQKVSKPIYRMSTDLPVSMLSISDVKKENLSTQKHPEQNPGSAEPIPADREEEKSEGIFSVVSNWVVNGTKSFFSSTSIVEHQDTGKEQEHPENGFTVNSTQSFSINKETNPNEEHIYEELNYTSRFSSDSQNNNAQQQKELLEKTMDQGKGLKRSLDNTTELAPPPQAQQSWVERQKEEKPSEGEKSRS